MPDSSKRDARGRILDALRRELLGPSDPNEAIQEFPTSRYIVGRLAPATDAEADDVSYDEVDGKVDPLENDELLSISESDGDEWNGSGRLDDALDDARAAIAKAKGESQ